MKSSEATAPFADRRRARSPAATVIALLSVSAFLTVALTDWPLTTLSDFWSDHAMRGWTVRHSGGAASWPRKTAPNWRSARPRSGRLSACTAARRRSDDVPDYGCDPEAHAEGPIL